MSWYQLMCSNGRLGGARGDQYPSGSELPSFVAVEIIKEAAPLPVPASTGFRRRLRPTRGSAQRRAG
jgi:hypothetical protein